MRKRFAAAAMTVALLLVLPALPATAEETAGADDAAAAELIEVTEVEVQLSVVVKIDPDAAPALTEIAAAEGAAVAGGLIASRGLYLVEGSAVVRSDKVLRDTQKASVKLGKELAKDDRVVWAEPLWQATAEDNRFHAWPASSPQDAAEEDLAEQPALAALGLAEASTLATGAGTVVAVLDTGIDVGHPLLSDRLVSGYDMVDDDADPSDEANGVDDDGDGLADEAFGHGTFVAGVVAQVAPDASILPVRVLDADGTGALHTVVEGIDFAVESGADVINLSFGLVEKSDSKALKAALKRARKAGVVVVAAAGNDGDEEKRFPAAVNDVVSVTASDRHGVSLAHFASRGKWVDVAAPGEGVVSAMPGGGYAQWDGSSMAAPVVSGQVALLVELRPEDDAAHLEKFLWKTSRKTIDTEGAEHGIVNILDSCREAG